MHEFDNKPFFDQQVKNKQEAYEKLSRNDDFTTGNLLDFSYHQNYYKLIRIDLSRQTHTNIPQQIDFVKKLEKDDCATMFFIDEKEQKAILSFYWDFLIVIEQYNNGKSKTIKFIEWCKWFQISKKKIGNFYDNSKANYDAVMKWSFKSNLSDYNEAYILVKSIITVRPASQTQI